MAYFYFFKKDDNCKWLMKEINELIPKYLFKPIDYNGKKTKFYVVLDWIVKKNRGANLKWIDEIGVNYVEKYSDLPENSGIYITGYDADIQEVEDAKKKGIPIIDHACPWVSQLRKQLLNINHNTHQCILMIDEGHMVYECFKSAFPKDIIIVQHNNYKEKLKVFKNKKPSYLLVYTVFRKKDAENISKFIEKEYPHPDNILNNYKKTLCVWTKQGLFEELEEHLPEKKLDEVWIICSSDKDRSTMSIINEVNEHGAKPVIIKEKEDIPMTVKENNRIGILNAPIPIPKKIRELKNFIKDRFDLSVHSN
jgi:4-hydroxy-3-methylbut-2-enyl diphosphate reductase IspH